jgi:pyruvate-formate lyase-activating enzyme
MLGDNFVGADPPSGTGCTVITGAIPCMRTPIVIAPLRRLRRRALPCAFHTIAAGDFGAIERLIGCL